MSIDEARRAVALVYQNPTLADRVIGYLSPMRGVRRAQARATLALMGGYTGGRRDKRALSSWRPFGGSADVDLIPDLAMLRERSRDLERNSPIGVGAINTTVGKVVGTGLSLQSRLHTEVLGISADEAAQWQRDTELRWRSWCETTACDATRTQDFYGIQDLVFRSALASGDVFPLLPYARRPGETYGLKVSVVEADRVSNPWGERDRPGFSGGVETDIAGAPAAYHILRTHPGDFTVTTRVWDRVAAFGAETGRRNVLHVFDKRRPGQSRGVPYLAPVIEHIKQLDRYTESEVFAAVLTAMVAIVTKTEGPGPSPLESAVSGVTPALGNDADRSGTWDGTLTPGLAVDLGVNESIENMMANRPNSAFDPFFIAMMRQVGMALEIPFEVLVKHYTASYSAARAAMLDAWHFFRRRRAWLASVFCQPVYEAWLWEDLAMGNAPAPGFFDDPLIRWAWSGALWVGDGAGAIDPLKEALGAEKRLELNLTTLQKETMEYDGTDWESNHRQRVREKQAQDRDGLTPAPPPVPGAAPAEPEPPPDKPENAMAEVLAAVQDADVAAFEGLRSLERLVRDERLERSAEAFAEQAAERERATERITKALLAAAEKQAAASLAAAGKQAEASGALAEAMVSSAEAGAAGVRDGMGQLASATSELAHEVAAAAAARPGRKTITTPDGKHYTVDED